MATRIKNGYRPRDIFVFVGNKGWQKANEFLNFHAVVAFPPDSNSPDLYRWDFMCGFTVTLHDSSGVGVELVRHLAYEFLKAGAKIIAFISVNFNVNFFRQGGLNL